MGRVHNQTVNEGRGCQEFYNLSLSDEKTIKNLIQLRTKIDEMYEMKLYQSPNPCVSDDVRVFKEPIEVIYIDLDNLIKKTKLSDNQKMVIDLLMKGYTVKDISEIKNKSLNAVTSLFEIAIRKLKEQNDYDWLQFIETSGHYKIPNDAKYKQCSMCGEFKRADVEIFPYDKANGRLKSKCKACESEIINMRYNKKDKKLVKNTI